MDGLTRAAIDKAEPESLAKKRLRPRDAGTLILIDNEGAEPRVLMGKRAMRHAFMPGKFVFPGGRTDPGDARVAIGTPLRPDVEALMTAGLGTRASAARCRAIALSAVRETWEEAGLLIGEKSAAGRAVWPDFAENGLLPALGGLRAIARAVTPPGRIRRFDTWFFAAFKSDIAAALPGGGPSGELEDLVWMRFEETLAADLPSITRTILAALAERLRDDPRLEAAGPAPWWRMRHGRYIKTLL